MNARANQDIAARVDDLLSQASWNHRLPALYEAGDDAEIIALVHAEGMPAANPLDLMGEAVALIIEQMRIVRLERAARGVQSNRCSRRPRLGKV